MATNDWQTKPYSVASLYLDPKNPRLGRESTHRAPRDLLQYLFDHDKAIEVAESIAKNGYFPSEPLLAVREDNRLTVVEGNRRLAALKALREPGLLEGVLQRRVERLSRTVPEPETIARVPVTVAPSRRATDRLLAARHVGTPVLPWQAENRASFILEKLEEGYSTEQLNLELGFSPAQILEARQTRAIADLARSLDLPPEIRAKLENPRVKLFTTLGRVFDSKVGRDYLLVEPDSEHGLRGRTTAPEFIRGFTRLVTDVALGRQSSRSLNTKEQISEYFESWNDEERPKKRRGTFVPADIIGNRSPPASTGTSPLPAKKSRQRPMSATVLPKDLKVNYGHDRLKDIRAELVRLKREEYPNAGAVLLRVFLELSIVDYLKRTGRYSALVDQLDRRGKLPQNGPTMRHLCAAVTTAAKSKLEPNEFNKVARALKYDDSSVFNISELHAFVHQTEYPSARELLNFWERTEPLFRLMLEQAPEEL